MISTLFRSAICLDIRHNLESAARSHCTVSNIPARDRPPKARPAHGFWRRPLEYCQLYCKPDVRIKLTAFPALAAHSLNQVRHSHEHTQIRRDHAGGAACPAFSRSRFRLVKNADFAGVFELLYRVIEQLGKRRVGGKSNIAFILWKMWDGLYPQDDSITMARPFSLPADDSTETVFPIPLSR